MSAFKNAAQAIKDSGKEENIQKITNDEKLSLYGLYKQAECGDNNTDKPGMLTLSFEAKPKWNAWESHKGKSKEQAEKEYVELVRNLLTKYKVEKYIKDF
jgi:diazepam-binding inhibitor (GABA receptor modulating acyl-CoA-binding protein)